MTDSSVQDDLSRLEYKGGPRVGEEGRVCEREQRALQRP